MPWHLVQEQNHQQVAYPWMARLGEPRSPSSLFPYPPSVLTALEGGVA